MNILLPKSQKEEVEPISFELADWFYQQPVGKLLLNDKISEEMRSLRRQRGIKDAETIEYGLFQNLICQVRERLEIRYRTTLICTKRQGYSLASPQDHAEYAMVCVKRVYQGASRAQRLFPGVQRQHIPAAMKKVFGNSAKQVSELKNGAQQFILQFNQMRKEKKEIEHAKA